MRGRSDRELVQQRLPDRARSAIVIGETASVGDMSSIR
jgi:hypothetical protein